MTVLRELIARFSIDVDTKPLSDLDRRLDRARDTVNSMGRQLAVVAAGAAAAGYALTEMASRANENTNVINQVFADNSDSVIQWSKTLGKEMGRSEYTLQESAGRFGSFLGPVFRDSGMDITAMSEKLSELSVDLASFYNTSDEDAMMRLFSGMSGETEAVRRLGIDISDTSLADLNKKNGDNRRLASLTLQEKSVLRFQKILQDTEEKQGDAARTAGGWANTQKRLMEQMKTLGTELGQRLIPVALRLANFFEDKFLPVMEDLADRTTVFETALEASVITLGLFTAGFLALNPILAALVVVAFGLGLLWEDYNTMMRGGKSVLGDFLEIMGDKSALEEVDTLQHKWVGIFDVWTSLLTDWVYWISWIVDKFALLGGVDMGTIGDGNSTSRALARYNSLDTNAQGVKAGSDNTFETELLAAAAADDPRTFEAVYAKHKKSAPSASEFNANFMRKRKDAYEGGLFSASEQDVADGTADQVGGKGIGPRVISQPQPGSITLNVNVGSANATPEQIAAAMHPMLRQVELSLLDKK